MEWIRTGSEVICSGFERIGVNCETTIISLNIWHIFITAFIFSTVTLVAYLILRHRRLERYDQVLGAQAPYGAASTPRTLRLNPQAMAKALLQPGFEGVGITKTAKSLNEKFSHRYFVVEIREGGRRLLQRELKLVAWRYRLQANEFQTDAETLALIKKGSESKYDDDTSDATGADGDFDIYVRLVRWWDFRHWLNHPSREIRYALYVAIFAAFLEYSSDLIEALRALFSAPN